MGKWSLYEPARSSCWPVREHWGLTRAPLSPKGSSILCPIEWVVNRCRQEQTAFSTCQPSAALAWPHQCLIMISWHAQFIVVSTSQHIVTSIASITSIPKLHSDMVKPFHSYGFGRTLQHKIGSLGPGQARLTSRFGPFSCYRMIQNRWTIHSAPARHGWESQPGCKYTLGKALCWY